MRKEHRPLWLLQLNARINTWIIENKIRPQFAALGNNPAILKPLSLQIFGEHISAGNFIHLIGNRQQPIKLSTWSSKQSQGQINIGHYCLISPGVTVSSAQSIRIGDNCMLAAQCYLSDSDWHGIYNRIRPFRCSAPITLHDNVWLGLRSVICKGVIIGENSIIGAGSVVTGDIPANVIAAGNPARVIKTLNPNRKMLKREQLFVNSEDHWHQMNQVHQFFCRDNSTLAWLKSLIWPRRND
ncbi:MAG: acyltransferase [Cellvibrionaceae bacterium]|nr:acyltransferase [Cellvibrionaceae bacterium]